MVLFYYYSIYLFIEFNFIHQRKHVHFMAIEIPNINKYYNSKIIP